MTKDKLRQAIKSLPLLPEYAPPLTWQARRMELRQFILEHDPDKFLTWPVIASTMITDPEYQHYHLDQWESKTSLRIKDLKSIVEFGGGYGAMVQACFNRGFEGQYYSYDFPEMLLLQEFYLSGLNIPIPRPYKRNEYCDLLIAICSLSEVDKKTKNKFFSGAMPDHSLVRYQYHFDDENNHEYFNGFSGHHWCDTEDTNHWYWAR